MNVSQRKMALFQTTYMKLHKDIPHFKSRKGSFVLLAVCSKGNPCWIEKDYFSPPTLLKSLIFHLLQPNPPR